ncbi:hypothetical protein BE08_01165 [Sorangium cellulosum]|uniref:Uncharacterized protein n=1 Tax=Sorangium cellulosum TaxID=56 RepID=A0A150PQ64_SORCE|nr:hypothetical protein BE08_01165 [Sorangium cellulosum]
MIPGGQEPLALLTADSERNLDVLRRGLRRAASFAFYVVLAADAARAEVLRRLRAWSGSGGVPELRFFAEGAAGVGEVARFLAVSDRTHPLASAVIPDGVALVETDGGAVVASLNMARDVLGKLIRGPLVLVIAADRAPELSRMAPDLFDVRAATLEIASMPGEPAPTFALALGEKRDKQPARSRAELQAEAARLRAFADEEIPAGALADAWIRLGRAFFEEAELGEARSAAEEARRLAEGIGYKSGVADALALEARVLEMTGPSEAWEQALRRTLALRREAGDIARTAGDLCRLGRGVAFLGRPEEAEGLLRESLGLCEQLGDVRGRAIVLGHMAELLARRGQLDEALRIRQQEELPVYERLGDVRARAVTLGKIADVLEARGQLDEALRIRQQEELPVYERLGDVRSRAATLGDIADIYHARGQLDEALRIRQQEQLPVYERLGDVHSRAVTLGKIADVLQARGQLDEALRIRQQEELPVYVRLGDVRSRAVTLGDIADICHARGQLDEALRIRQQEELPVYERLGDVRARAVTLGKIADVLEARGQLDEALRIRQQEVLPVYERLGDASSRSTTLAKIADIYQAQGQLDEALHLLEQEVLPVHERLGAVRLRAVTLGRIAGVLQARGQLDEALHLLEHEVLPVHERLGDIRGKLVCQTNMAIIHLARPAAGDRQVAAELLRSAGRDAERLRLPEAETIRELQRSAGLEP